MKVLQCQMSDDCKNPVTHIGEKGYIYCASCVWGRRGWERCRKMRGWELKLTQAGEPIPSYRPLRLTSAPKLLEACRAALAEAVGQPSRLLSPETVDLLRDAISAAKGR